MLRLFHIAWVLPALATTALLAQSPKLPPDVSRLPDEIKNLPWQTIDIDSVPTLERCRSLMLLNNTLDELSANAAAEADLMSAYIEQNNLGAQFASTPPPSAPPPARVLGYADAEKVAVAILRGPMSASHYASDLAGMGGDSLKSYEQMYARTCARRWSEFDESRHQVRSMSAFLGRAKKLPDYDAWATAESARREVAAEQRLAAAPSAAAAKAQQDQKLEAQLRQQRLEIMQMNSALAAAHAQQEPPPQQAASAQQAAAANQTLTPAGQPAQAVNGGYVVDNATAYGYDAYGGYGGYGYAYIPPGAAGGAVAAGAAVGAGAGAAQYHAANSTWNRESTYNSAARDRTESRMSSFHGAGGRRR